MTLEFLSLVQTRNLYFIKVKHVAKELSIY